MTLIGTLYSAVGIIALFGYLPQIFTLIKSKTSCPDVNIFAWIIWFISWVISLIYGVVELQDLKFSIVAFINTACVGAIALITLYKRRKYTVLAADIPSPVFPEVK